MEIQYFEKVILKNPWSTIFNFKMKFFRPKMEPENFQKPLGRGFASEVQKCIEKRYWAQTRRVGEKASRGGLGAYLILRIK